MTGRRAPRVDSQFFPDPLAAASQVADAQAAVELADIIQGLAQFDQGTIKGFLFRKPRAGVYAKFENLEQLAPPFEYGALMDYVRNTYGGGEYRLQLFVAGKTRHNFEFVIAGKPKPLPGEETAAEKDMGGAGGLMQMLLAQQEASRRDMIAAQNRADERQAEYQRQADERQARRDTAMWGAAAVIVPALAPILLGGREKLGDLLAVVNANRPEPTNLKDTVETMVLVKKLLGDDKAEGFDPDNIAGSLARLAGPIAAAAGRAFSNGRQPPADQPQLEPATYEAGDGLLHLPGPPGAPAAAPPPTGPGAAVLALIRPDVLYFFSRRLDPALAAEAIVDIMVRADVSEGDLGELVAAFGGSADWQTDLAAQGLDLRADAEWANAFLNELVAAWSERDGDAGHSGRGAGGAPNAGVDAPPGAPGLAGDADSRARA